jgi:L-aminopeptidase/D-esterase-like protein
LEIDGEFGAQGKRAVKLPPKPTAEPIQNTTIGVVATDATLTKPQAQKVAQMAQDGIARAIRPAHTMFDGDTVFCLATGQKELTDAYGFFLAPQAQCLNELGHAAADCMSRAIIRAVLSAESLAGMCAFRDLENLS